MSTITQQTDQIQIRIDSKTKLQAKKILEDLGLDISSAVKIMLKQIINTGTLPYEIRDSNDFTTKKFKELKEAMIEVRNNNKRFKSGHDLIKDAIAIPKNNDLLMIERKDLEIILKNNMELQETNIAILAGELALLQNKTSDGTAFLKSKLCQE